MKGHTPFSFSIKEMEIKWGDLGDKELFVKGYFRDFYFMGTQNGTSVTRVIKDAIVMKRLGKKFRTFKPDVPFTVYVSVLKVSFLILSLSHICKDTYETSWYTNLFFTCPISDEITRLS